ncbi:MAG: hypothetical protein HY874_03595 [Chloroflexi bacterium]|nr:hypothetical protein [Chloroflexota bacterium]
MPAKRPRSRPDQLPLDFRVEPAPQREAGGGARARAAIAERPAADTAAIHHSSPSGQFSFGSTLVTVVIAIVSACLGAGITIGVYKERVDNLQSDLAKRQERFDRESTQQRDLIAQLQFENTKLSVLVDGLNNQVRDLAEQLRPRLDDIGSSKKPAGSMPDDSGLVGVAGVIDDGLAGQPMFCRRSGRGSVEEQPYDPDQNVIAVGESELRKGAVTCGTRGVLTFEGRSIEVTVADKFDDSIDGLPATIARRFNLSRGAASQLGVTGLAVVTFTVGTK